MSKKIILNFNADGTLNMGTSSVDEIRQGDKGVIIEANFAEKNNVNYVARLNFTRHDTKHIDNVLLTPDPTDTHKYTKVLDSLWYFAINGDTTLTVFLTRSGQTVANGQFTFSVQKTDFTGDTTITPDEYEELLELIASKLDITAGIVRLDQVDSLADFNAGQVLFVLNGGSKYDNHTVLVKVNATKTDTDLLFDFSVSSKIVDDVEVTTTKTAESISYKVDLLNEQEEVIATFTIAIPSATTTQAGLMSASDKEALDNVPSTYETKEDANTHKNNKNNPHEVTKAQVGLGNVTNDAQVKRTEIGVASGVATLDSNAKIPTSQLPDSVLGQLHYKGVFDASTGTSGLAKQKGDYYVCQVGGSKNPDGTTHSGEPYAVGDWAVYNGSSWDKIDNTDAVSSVQGRTGAVVITKNDLSLENVDNTSDLDKPISTATAIELAKKQNKVKVSNVAPNPSDYEENDVIFVPSIEVGDDIVGEGLEEETDETTGIKTLKVDFDVVARKDEDNTFTGTNTFSDDVILSVGARMPASAAGSLKYSSGNDALKFSASSRTVEVYNNLKVNGNITDGTNSVAVADIVDLSSAQTITGQKTFSSSIIVDLTNGILLGDQGYYSIKKPSGNDIQITTYGGIKIKNFLQNNEFDFSPFITEKGNLGLSTKKWKNLYLAGKITDGTNEKTVAEIAAGLITAEERAKLGRALVEPVSAPTSEKLVAIGTDGTQKLIDKPDYLKTQSTGGATSIQLKEWVGTQDQFDSITTKDANTRYTIIADGFNVNLSFKTASYRTVVSEYLVGIINFDEDDFDFSTVEGNKDIKVVISNDYAIDPALTFYKGLSNPLSNVKRIRITTSGKGYIDTSEINYKINGVNGQAEINRIPVQFGEICYFDIYITEDCDLEIELPRQD